jgi:fused signal recognition particle receptor
MSSDQKPVPDAPARGGLLSRFLRRDKQALDAPSQPIPGSEPAIPAAPAPAPPVAPPAPDPLRAAPADAALAPSEGREPARRGLFRRALARTGAGLGALLLGRKAIDEALYEELETRLLLADVGVEVCTGLIGELTARVKRRDLKDAGALREELRELLIELLQPCQRPLALDGGTARVILVIGVNGAGKTTTIGKLAHRLQAQGKSVMLAAGDTFRAAAVEQLQAWGERNRIPVVAQGTGADSASVIFDAIQSARARGVDVVIADTAGRLHTKSNLMAELAKVRRVMAKLDPDAPHETLLVLDAGTGQNAVAQMRQFSASVPVTGIALTKLDGTARGGVIFALCREFGVPIRFVGLGEGLGDLQEFDAELFVDALLAAPGA